MKKLIMLLMLFALTGCFEEPKDDGSILHVTCYKNHDLVFLTETKSFGLLAVKDGKFDHCVISVLQR